MSKFFSFLLRHLPVLMIIVVLFGLTQAWYISPSAQGKQTEERNKYIKVLEGENFRTDIENVEDGVDAVTKTYHKTVNDLFNGFLVKMVRLGDSEKEEDVKRLTEFITPPAFDKDQNGQPTKRKPCSAGKGVIHNLSSYCLSLVVLDEYFDFREAMLEARKKAREQAAQRFENVKKKPEDKPTQESTFEGRTPWRTIGDVFQAQRSLQGYGEVLNRIDTEIDLARQTLDQTLAAYNEFQLALPLHNKYQKVIKALEKYRDKIASVRKEVQQYPNAFYNATTASCL